MRNLPHSIMETGSESNTELSSETNMSDLPARYKPTQLQDPPTSSFKKTRFYTEGDHRVCFIDFSEATSPKSVQPRLYDPQLSSKKTTPWMISKLRTPTATSSPTDARQTLPARPRYTSEEEDWIMNFVNENPEKSWQHVTDGFNLAFNQQRTLKGMQIKGYSLFESKAKNGTMNMPTGLRQLRKKEGLEVEDEDADEDADEDEDEGEGEDSEEEEDESEQENTVASVGKRYTAVQENWLLSYVANNAKSGRRKDWVGTAAAFAAKFGLQRAPMSLNNKWTHLSRQSASTALFSGQGDLNAKEGKRRTRSNSEATGRIEDGQEEEI